MTSAAARHTGVKAPVLLLLLLPAASIALKCYVSPQDGGAPQLQQRADWLYCAFQHAVYPADGGVTASAPAHFGVNRDIMDVESADRVFGESAPAANYHVIGHCVLERFGAGVSGGNGSSSGHEAYAAEFAFRCLCAVDGCNAGANVLQWRNNNVRLGLAA